MQLHVSWYDHLWCLYESTMKIRLSSLVSSDDSQPGSIHPMEGPSDWHCETHMESLQSAWRQGHHSPNQASYIMLSCAVFLFVSFPGHARGRG